MVVGGSDTTSNSIEFAMAEMMNKPEVIKRAQQELDEVVGRDNMVEESHIYKLPYLFAVMEETLRLHPAHPIALLKPPLLEATLFQRVLESSLTCGQYTGTLQFGRILWNLIRRGSWILNGTTAEVISTIFHLGPEEEYVLA